MTMAEMNNSGAVPALESMVRFATQRQKLLASNIANLSTPDYRQQDVSIKNFQSNLRDALERRRTGGPTTGFELEQTSELDPHSDGSFTLRPGSIEGGVLFHDRNNRNLEELMQAQVENTTALRVATDLLRNHNDMLRSAIAQRV